MRELTDQETGLVAGGGSTYSVCYDPDTLQPVDECWRTDDPEETSSSI